MPILQSKFMREPMGHLVGADYSHYDRSFETRPSDYFMQFINDKTATRAIDLKKVMSDFRFPPSQSLVWNSSILSPMP
jgi:hypothetical protein